MVNKSKMKGILFFGIFWMISVMCKAQINIWENTSCHEKVEMTPYLAEGDNNVAMIICPGGSYFWHDMNTEGHDVAKWLQSNGISAFVLRYRTANVFAFILPYRYFFRGNRFPDPQNDLRRALSVIRNDSNKHRIDPNKVGVMGFSAGGHLAMYAAEFLPPKERPSFVALVYPVITMIDYCTHKRSRRALLGENKKNNKELQQSLSLERNVPKDCHPVFLVNCKDDPIVKYQNSILLDSALTSNNIDHKYILYQTGGHSFGVSEKKGSSESRQWKDEFIKWLKKYIQ